MSARPGTNTDGDDELMFAVGIEDTAIGAPLRHGGQRLDEYELTGHLEQWREDLARAGATGPAPSATGCRGTGSTRRLACSTGRGRIR